MAQKKSKKSQKLPERSISAKINYYKGETRTLRTRLKYLEKRVASLETTLGDIRKQLPEDEVECIKKEIKKIKSKEAHLHEFKQDFVKKFRPKHKDSKDE